MLATVRKEASSTASSGTVSTSRMNLMNDVKGSSEKFGSTLQVLPVRGRVGGGDRPSWKHSR